MAAIAQLVEHIIRNDGVGGSIPSCGTTLVSQNIHNRLKFKRKQHILPDFVSNAVLIGALASCLTCWGGVLTPATYHRGRTNVALTDLAIRQAKAESKIRKLLDGGDLQLRVTPADAKRWRLA